MKPRKRREFLIDSTRAVMGFSLVPLAGCSTGNSKPTAAHDPFLESLVADWEKAIPQWLEETKLPGVSVAIIRQAKLAWRRGWGVEDTGTNKPVDNKSIFAACSNTKPVFAYAVAKLCERGLMDLDTPLTKYASERIIADPRLDLITARHVLTHTTGFPNWRQEPEPLTLQFTPGEKYQYSGEGFSYLQSIVVRLTGQSFEDFMRSNILVPFGMSSSRFSWDMAYARRLAKPHDNAGKRIPGKYFTLPSAEEKAWSLDRYGAAAGLLTTPTDYAKFLIEILNPKPADAFRLSETGLREYLRPQVKKSEALSVAFSWVSPVGQPSLITHAGQDAGFYCVAAASVDRKAGIMVMMNGDDSESFMAKLNANKFAQQLLA